MKPMLYSLSAVCGNLAVGGVVGETFCLWGFGQKLYALCRGAGLLFVISTLVINLASVPGGELVNSPTTQSLRPLAELL